jgi:hypothetical protein
MAKTIRTSAPPLSESLRRLAVYFPVLLAVLLMLPRLLAPEFGLFDDGGILVTADKIAHGTWYTGADSVEGRFRPIHWLWFTLSYLVGGKNPFWFYLANTLAFALIVAGLIYLVHTLTGSRLQAWIAGLVFVLAGPVGESFLTLKGEVILLTLIVLSLLVVLLYPRARNVAQKAGVSALTALVLSLAYLTKETTLVLLPVSMVWYLLARFWPGYEKDPVRTATRGAYLLANLVAAPVFFLLRKTAISGQISGGTYSGQYSFQLGQIGDSALRWAGWLARDFLWVVPLGLLAILLLILRRTLPDNTLLIDAFVWMGAWVCIYLPWNFMAEYYMLPFALGLAVFVSACIVAIVPAWRKLGWRRWTCGAVAAVSLVLLVGTLLNSVTNARVQLAVDAANARMLAYLVHSTDPGSTIVVNIQDPNEYYYEMQTQLAQVDGRPDLKLLSLYPGMDLSGESGTVYIISPFLENQPQLTVRMGVIESTQNAWNAKLRGFLAGHPGSQVLFESSNSFWLSDVNYPRIFCSFIKTRAFCAASVPLLDIRPFTYGWTIYQLPIH